MSLEEKFDAAVNVIRSLPKSVLTDLNEKKCSPDHTRDEWKQKSGYDVTLCDVYSGETKENVPPPLKRKLYDVDTPSTSSKITCSVLSGENNLIEDETHKHLPPPKKMDFNTPTRSYQPSNELMLRFYSFFKQATEGACDKPKPGFWDVVNRAKWESWNKLGDMSREQAMQAYVDELNKIVETMSYSADVAQFLSAGETLGPALALLGARPPPESGSASGASTPRPRARTDSEDEYIDTLDSEPEVTSRPARLSNGHAHQITSQLTQLKVLEELPGTLARLERDVAALRKAVEGDRRALDRQQRAPRWRWPWRELSLPTLALLLLWPLLASRLAARRRT